MSLFGIRRGRNGRTATVRLVCETSTDWRGFLSDRRNVARLALGLATIAALTVSVQAWKHAFPFRLDQRPVGGVAALIDFERVNPERTARARDRAAEQVPPVFSPDPRALLRAPEELRAALAPFAQVTDMARLPVETRRAFGLAVDGNQPAGSGGLPPGDRAEAFEKLRQIANSGQQLSDLVSDFAKFLQPLEKSGLLRGDHITAELSAIGQLAVSDVDGTTHVVDLS